MDGFNSNSKSQSVLGSEYGQVGSLRLEFISRSFDVDSSIVDAISDVNLSIGSGEFVAITGQSGSGKSTLLNILGLLDSPSSGKYYIGSEDVSKLSSSRKAALRKNKFGFIFQNFNLLDRYTVQQNVELAMAYQHISTKTLSELAFNLLKQMGLSDKINTRPHQLSGGQAQRVAIARALINSPPIILADEPTGNLDPSSAREVMQLLKALNRKGTTIVMVTHDEGLAEMADRRIFVNSGKITEGTADV
jgi:putative bacteriocin export ABC transporter (lactococcin 972 group)